MRWDREDLLRYERWLDSPAGFFFHAQEVKLYQYVTADWPRRARTLLDIGCAAGRTSQQFHVDGFTVSSLDCSPVMLEAARDFLGLIADAHLGEARHLPFDDDEFDYAALLFVPSGCLDPAVAISEAARVAKRGLLVSFLNVFSLSRFFVGSQLLPPDLTFFSPWRMRRLLKHALGNVPVKEASTLLWPPMLWKQGFPLYSLATLTSPLPVGTLCAYAVDLTAEPPLTGLPAWTGKILNKLRTQSLFDKAGASG